MKEELDQIVKNDTWEFVPRPKDMNVIGNKWVFRNKMNEQGEVLRNKQYWYVKVIHNSWELISKKLLHLLLDWSQ